MTSKIRVSIKVGIYLTWFVYASVKCQKNVSKCLPLTSYMRTWYQFEHCLINTTTTKFRKKYVHVVLTYPILHKCQYWVIAISHAKSSGKYVNFGTHLYSYYLTFCLFGTKYWLKIVYITQQTNRQTNKQTNRAPDNKITKSSTFWKGSSKCQQFPFWQPQTC